MQQEKNIKVRERERFTRKQEIAKIRSHQQENHIINWEKTKATKERMVKKQQTPTLDHGSSRNQKRSSSAVKEDEGATSSDGEPKGGRYRTVMSNHQLICATSAPGDTSDEDGGTPPPRVTRVRVKDERRPQTNLEKMTSFVSFCACCKRDECFQNCYLTPHDG